VIGDLAAKVADDRVDEGHRGSGHPSGVGRQDEKRCVRFVEHRDVEGFDADHLDRRQLHGRVSCHEAQTNPGSDGLARGDFDAIAHSCVHAEDAK
jgi:hypothetical protein